MKKHLANQGVIVDDILGMRHKQDMLSKAWPILFDLLPEIRVSGVRSDVVRTIAHSSIKPDLLIGELERIKNFISPSQISPGVPKERQDFKVEAHSKAASEFARYGWVVGEAIRIRMQKSAYQKVAIILQDQAYSTARQMLPEALLKVKSKREETIKILCALIDDPDITPNVIDVLARAKAIEAIPLIQPYTESPIPLVKREAQKAIKKLEKLRDKQIKPTKPPALTKVTSGPSDGLIESSMNFDAEQIPAFLRKVFKQLQKVDRRVAAEVRDVLLAMEIDEARAFTFDVTHNDQPSTVHLRLFMDDEGAADLAIYAEPEIAAIIDQVMEADMM